MAATLRRAPAPDPARRLDEVFGTPGTVGRLGARLRDLPFPAASRAFAAYEAVAVPLRTFARSLMPGLMQTPGYATAVLRAGPGTRGEDIGELAAARLARQAVLGREGPPIVRVLPGEGVPHRPAAPPDVMYRQLTHLAEMPRLPSIAIQVVPYGAGGLPGAFVIAGLGGPAGIVFLGDVADGRVTEDAAAISRVILRFDSLRGEALPRSASRDMNAGVAGERWRPRRAGGHRISHARPAPGTGPAPGA